MCSLRQNEGESRGECYLPFLGISHHDGAALGIVRLDAHGKHVVAARDAELLVDLELDGQAVAVPAEAALDVVAGLVRVPADDVLRPAARAREPRTIGLGWRWRVGAVRGWP